MIRLKKNHILTQVKGNQKQLLETIKQICKYSKAVEVDIQTDSRVKRNRLETRKLSIFAPNISYLSLGYIYDLEWRKHVRVAIKLEKKVKHYQKKQVVKTTLETSYFISTTGKFSAKELNQIIREHWFIENKNHYVRDEVLKEDRSQIRKKAGVFVRLRSFALNLMRNLKVNNIAREIHKNTLDMRRMLRLYFSVE